MSEDEPARGALVCTWDYDLTDAEWYWHTARAYLDCSLLILSEIVNQTSPDYHHWRVAKFNRDHSLELFLKATILQAGRQPTNTHALQQLYSEFRNLYPGKKFEFRVSIAKMVRSNPDRPASIYPRYPTDKSGKKWKDDAYQLLGKALELGKMLRDDCERIWPLVQERYPSQ